MPLDPDSVRVLEEMATWPAPEVPTVEWARQSEVRRQRELDRDAEAVASTERIDLPTGTGTIPAIVHRPAGSLDGVIVHLHGGGWTIGSPDLWSSLTTAMANAARSVVVVPAFRLAPEHPFPAGLEDAYAAVCWAADRRDDLGAATGGVVVAGDSSGGNLAAAAAQMARDRGHPAIAGQLLMYPATVRDIDTASRHLFAEGFGLTTEALSWFWGHYLDGGTDATDPYVSPLLAADHSGLAPAVVLTAECDVLRDEGEAYAERLRAAGVRVSARRFDGMLHGFLGYAGTVGAARRAIDWIGEELRALLAADTAVPVHDR